MEVFENWLAELEKNKDKKPDTKKKDDKKTDTNKKDVKKGSSDEVIIFQALNDVYRFMANYYRIAFESGMQQKFGNWKTRKKT